jgi:hypothetical protein
MRYKVTLWTHWNKHWHRKELSNKVQEATESVPESEERTMSEWGSPSEKEKVLNSLITRFRSLPTQNSLRHEGNLTFEWAIKILSSTKQTARLKGKQFKSLKHETKIMNTGGKGHWHCNSMGSPRSEQSSRSVSEWPIKMLQSSAPATAGDVEMWSQHRLWSSTQEQTRLPETVTFHSPNKNPVVA